MKTITIEIEKDRDENAIREWYNDTKEYRALARKREDYKSYIEAADLLSASIYDILTVASDNSLRAKQRIKNIKYLAKENLQKAQIIMGYIPERDNDPL